MAASPPPVTAAAPRWGLGDAVGGWLVGFSAAIVAAGAWVAATGDDEAGLGPFAVQLVALWAGLLGAVALASRRKGTGDLGADFGFSFRPVDVALGVAAGVASQALVALAFVPLEWAFPDLDVGAAAEEALDGGFDVPTAVRAALVVLGAPVVEELFFRGLLQRALARRVGPALAVAGSSVLFGLAHVGQVLAALPALMAFGAVLGALAARSGRLGPSVVAHATFNLLTVVAVVS